VKLISEEIPQVLRAVSYQFKSIKFPSGVYWLLGWKWTPGFSLAKIQLP